MKYKVAYIAYKYLVSGFYKTKYTLFDGANLHAIPKVRQSEKLKNILEVKNVYNIESRN
jgi:hypothetical protein